MLTRETRNVKHIGFSVQWERFMLVSVWKAGMDAVNNLVIALPESPRLYVYPGFFPTAEHCFSANRSDSYGRGRVSITKEFL